MPQKLSNFPYSQEIQIAERGEEIYARGGVRNLTFQGNGEWEAIVLGSQAYETSIRLDGEYVADYDCDCPYDWGPVCKHIVAMSLALLERILEEDGEANVGMLSVEEEIQLYAKGLKRQDLLGFLIDECKSNRGLLDNFKLRFAGSTEEIPKPDYAKMIQGGIDLAMREGGYDYVDELYLRELLDKLLKRLHHIWQKGQWEEVWEVCEWVLEKIPRQIEWIPEEISPVEDGVMEVLQYYHGLFDADGVPESLKLQMRKYALENWVRPDLMKWGLGDVLWSILVDLPDFEQVVGEIEKQVDTQISDLKRKSAGEWDLFDWMNKKEKLLELTDRKDEISVFLKGFIYIPRIREKLVQEEINAGRYQKAKVLLREAIQAEMEKPNGGFALRWQKHLLDIAQLEKDNDILRVLAEQLFWGSANDFKYYDLLKSTYNPAEWSKKVAKIIEEIQNPTGRIGASQVARLATVFVKEKLHDRLLRLLQNNSGHYNIIAKFSFPLIEKFPEEVLALYKTAIEVFAKNHLGRSSYLYLVEMLQALDKLPGGKALRNRLVNDFRETYYRRPAMMEILGKHF